MVVLGVWLATTRSRCAPCFARRGWVHVQVLAFDASNVEAIACLGAHYFYSDQPEIAIRFYRRLLQVRLAHRPPPTPVPHGLWPAADVACAFATFPHFSSSQVGGVGKEGVRIGDACHPDWWYVVLTIERHLCLWRWRRLVAEDCAIISFNFLSPPPPCPLLSPATGLCRWA